MIKQYLGAIHIHSLFSDGTANVEEISLAAKKAGLSWIIITDHNNMDIEEGFYNGVCVIKGEEISPTTNNHYLALNIKKIIKPTMEPEQFIEETHKQNGFGFIAHPDESQNRKNKYSPIYWENKEVIPDGIEIWNWFSTWADNYCDKSIFHIVYCFLFRHQLVKKANEKSLQWWDKLNNQNSKIIPAICGVDAHALKIKKYIIPVTVFPYEMMFKTLTNVISINSCLNEDFEIQKQQILHAIKNGNNLVLNRHVTKNIPEINIKNKESLAKIGGSIKLDNETTLNVNYNKKVIISIWHNGQNIYQTFDKILKLPINKMGKYRVELLTKNYAIAYSNPIIVE